MCCSCSCSGSCSCSKLEASKVVARARLTAVLSWLALASAPLHGQRLTQSGIAPRAPSPTHDRYPAYLGPSDRTFWVASAAALTAAVALDRTARPAIRGLRTPFLDRLAPLGDVFGTAKYTVPTVTATFIAAHLSHNADWEDATRHITLSYIVSDVTEALIKGAVGRQRPRYAGDPWRFHPLSLHDEWHSFPSGHVTHITAIAAALAEEAHSPWVTGLGAGAVALTGWQRIYRDQHWASDVVGGIIVGTAGSRLTAHWFRHKRQAAGAGG